MIKPIGYLISRFKKKKATMRINIEELNDHRKESFT